MAGSLGPIDTMDDRPDHRTGDTYTFGDSPTAADRLRPLAEVYAPPTRDLLARWAPPAPAHALDLGCGPGHTTHLVHAATGATRTTGIERSPEHLARARAAPRPGVAFVEADVTVAPLPVDPADLVFVRHLLTHLSDPAAALRGWTRALRPGGRMLVQETAVLTSDQPTLARYYELVGDLQRHHGQDLEIGARLGALADAAGLHVVSCEQRPVRVPQHLMARLHALNLPVWRRDPYARAAFDAPELADLERRLAALARSPVPGAAVEHVLGELVVGV